MKNFTKYILSGLMAVSSFFACQEEMAEDPNVKPIYTDESIGMSVDMTMDMTKAYMGEKNDGRYPFFWQESGESVTLLERASLIGNSSFTAIQNMNSKEDYSLSEDKATACFSFDVKELSNGDAFEYYVVSPASCFNSADVDGMKFEVPSVQTSLASSPDPEAILLWNSSTEYDAQPSSLNFEKGFGHPLAYVTFDVKNLPLLASETVSSVSLTFEGKAVTGPLDMDWDGVCAANDGSQSYVTVKTDNIDTKGDFSVCFTVIPFEMAEGDKVVVNVATSNSTLVRTISLTSKMNFPAAQMTSFGADMSSAERMVQADVRLSNGVEYSLNAVGQGIYEVEIPYMTNAGVTFLYGGTEYGCMAGSGSAMVGTHSSGKHLSRTIGRLAPGGEAIRMKSSNAETVLVRLDVSNGDGIPRYYLEIPQTDPMVVFHEDFSLMTWGGDYYTWADGVTPSGATAESVDGTEVATAKASYTQAPFGNKIFDSTNEKYISNRGLSDWTLEYCCERPFAMQVGHSNGAGSVTTPAFSSLKQANDVNLHIDMARFGGDSKNVKLTIEIIGSGMFDESLSLGSRDAYTCNYGSYPALIDVNLSEYDVVFGSDGKTLTTSSNGQGKIIPRIYNNDATFKPHTRLNLRILDADSSTKIKIYGEATTARFTIFDIKVVEEEGYRINGTKIDETSTLFGLARNVTTGEPIVGLPVTDGYTYTLTDVNGVYQMVGNEKARCIYPSIPAEYEIPLAEDGQPQIYQYISSKSNRYDFNLTERTTSWDDFTIMAITDVHFYSKGDDQTDEEDKFRAHHVPDITNYLSSASTSGEISKNVIAVSLGDNTSNYTEKLSHIRQNLYSLITMNGKVLPMFHAIGNHDHRGDALTDYEASADFVNVFGPTDFSINIGKAHIVFMDNTMCVEAEQPHKYGQGMSFVRGITDEQWAWLQADLANVKNKESKLLIMCMHAPIFGSTYTHFADIRNQMKIFGESHIMTGHLHKEITRDFTDVWNGKTGRLSQEHNLLALGGNWTNGWSDRISVDGTPMGYNVFNISGNMIKESMYNPVGQEDSYQFRIYNGGDKYENDKTIKRDEVDVTYKFDWTSLFRSKYADETLDMNGKFVVKVFAAGTRQKYWDVYLVDASGNKTKMKWHEKEIYDVCSLAYFYVHVKRTSADYAGTSAKNVWTIDVPEAYKSDPAKAFTEGGYKVVAEYTSPGGKVFTYENNHLQSTKTNLVGGFLPIPYEYYYKGFGYDE